MRSFVLKAAVIAIILTAPLQLFADTLFLSPASGTYTSGKTFVVNVYVSTPQAINAISGNISFPQDKLQVISVTKPDSILTLWVAEPGYSNVQGTVSFEGVVPNPGFIGSSGKIVTINFRVVGQGSATVKFDSASVLANDGSGTNILRTSRSATFNLGSAPVQDIIETVPAPVVQNVDPLTPKAPVVTSADFADSKLWYAKSTGVFSWNVPSDVTAAKLLFGKNSNSEPTVLYEPAIGNKELTDLTDGVWYLHAQFKNAEGWGGIAHYQFRVDNTKPDSFTITELGNQDETSPQRRFQFEATDGTSGIDKYGIQIDGGEAEMWRDDGTGIYVTKALLPGDHTMIARAYDEAGNFTVASVDFVIKPIPAPEIDTYTKEVTPESPLVVQGKALPGATIHVYLSKKGEEDLQFKTTADARGAFSALFNGEIPRGSYKLFAIAEDTRGAKSEPSAEKAIVVMNSKLVSLGEKLTNILIIIIPVVALFLCTLFMLVWGLHKINKFRRTVRKELRQVESTLDRAFELFKEDIEDSIHMLEHARTKRRLTEEEGEIINRFRENLASAEKVIKKEIRDVERELGG